MQKKEKGFTLVELSIVLVIIGLLIGGILAAQSMIRTAKIQSFVRQVSQFDTAVENFHTKYNGLPGDTSAFSCITYRNNVCDDGKILDDQNQTFGDDDTNETQQYPGFAGETGKFWNDLSLDGLLNPNSSNYTDCSQGCDLSNASAPGKYAPVAGYDSLAMWVAYCPGCNISSSPPYVLPIINYYIIAEYPSNFNADAEYVAIGQVAGGTSILKPGDMLAIDLKIDNGINDLAKSGSSVGGLVGSPGDEPSEGFIHPCSINHSYNVNDSRAVCIPYVRIGISSSDLH